MGRYCRKFGVSFLLLVCLCSAAAAQAAYTRAALWEKEINAFAERDKENFPKKRGLLFVGSSSIRGWRSAEQEFSEFRAINRGFGGSHIEDVINYAPQIVLPYKPKLIVLYAGENDLTAGKTVERVFDDLRTFLSLVHERLPKTKIIFVSLKPSPARWALADKFKAVNELAKAESAKDKQLIFVDVWTPMLNDNGEPKPEIFLNDRLHMNPEGYKIWHQTLYPAIAKAMR